MELDRLVKATKIASAPLSDAQKVTILGVLEDRETAMNAVRQGKVDRNIAEQQVRVLLESSTKAIRAALTEAQAKVFGSMRPAAMPGSSGGPNAPAASNGSSASSEALPEGAAPPEDEEGSLIDANTGGAPQASPMQ